jgi:hypothetical protein
LLPAALERPVRATFKICSAGEVAPVQMRFPAGRGNGRLQSATRQTKSAKKARHDPFRRLSVGIRTHGDKLFLGVWMPET